ncbi:MAG: ABC transporter ATP-binding protein [Candidatus Omnitrophica bacterium]|nr:ABC transporter ATP-binding protein [Candidatus Omnitrophota bacterium]
MIEARRVYKEYVMGKVTLQVLKGVSLQIDTGAFVAIVGPSGAGKSTLLHLLAGLDTPTSGEVRWDEHVVSRLSDRKRAEFRNRTLGIVFQFYHLLPELSAVENVMLPSLVRGARNSHALREQATACLKQVGLAQRVRHKPRELSGGEQQRVAIARALINEPKLLLCDEPTGNLDSKTGAEVIELLVGLHQRNRVGLVVVTHQMKLAESADQTIVLEDGRVVDHEGVHAQKGKR